MILGERQHFVMTLCLVTAVLARCDPLGHLAGAGSFPQGERYGLPPASRSSLRNCHFTVSLGVHSSNRPNRRSTCGFARDRGRPPVQTRATSSAAVR